MTIEEAIEILNNTAWLGTDIGIKVYPAVKMAVDALEKQIPKKLYYVSDGDADGYPVWDYFCPACESELDGCSYYDFCPYCGQALDWSDEE